jgi:acid phosphatase type 7
MATRPPAPAPADFLPCVEHGLWVPIPTPPPLGPLCLAFKEVDAEQARAVKEHGVLTFHAVGCSGHFGKPDPAARVVEAMAQQIRDPHRFGGHAGATPASFFFHLGDLVYKGDNRDDPEEKDQRLLFRGHFYDQYACYPRCIFAIPGNHDGKDSKHLEHSPIRHFLQTFCDSKRRQSPDDPAGRRLTMTQPYPYWVLKTPVAYIVGLYANDINAGQLDDPAGKDRPQYNWLVQTLRDIRHAQDGRAVLLAVHYPPYSGAANFRERGDPNLGPTPRQGPCMPLGMLLQQAYRDSKLWVDAVLSAHAHHYQRITYTDADGRQVPHLVAGCGGHGPIESIAATCDHQQGPAIAVPANVMLPPGLVLPPGDRAQVVAFNDQDFGFLRLTIDANKKTLAGEFFAAFSETHDPSVLPAIADSFVLDLQTHRIA